MATKEKLSAEQFLPKRRTLERLRAAARSCKGCDLYKNATQTVFGEGAKDANLVLVGEQPGDMEDRQGHPFVGPAGRMLDKALGEARIPREDVYITNAVKHFRWIQRGKRRLHKKTAGPSGDRVQALVAGRARNNPTKGDRLSRCYGRAISSWPACPYRPRKGKVFCWTKRRSGFRHDPSFVDLSAA
jgi:hypothetical protein